MNKKTQKSNIPLLTMNGEVVITVTQFEESFKEYEKEYEKEIKNRYPLFMEKWLENKKEIRLRFFKQLFFTELKKRWLFKKTKRMKIIIFANLFQITFGTILPIVERNWKNIIILARMIFAEKPLIHMNLRF
jgi:hypothetical protein